MFNMYLLAERLGLLNSKFAVMEIGVGPTEKTRVSEFIKKGYETHLIEGLPRYQAEIHRKWGHLGNVHVYPAIISDCAGNAQLYDRGEGSWLTKLPSSPDSQNKDIRIDPRHCHTAEAITLDMVDSGNLDMVLIDIEGAEWYALDRMTSRPSVLVLETHLEFHPYRNPYMNNITRWMYRNGYVILATERADTMWIKKEPNNVHP